MYNDDALRETLRDLVSNDRITEAVAATLLTELGVAVHGKRSVNFTVTFVARMDKDLYGDADDFLDDFMSRLDVTLDGVEIEVDQSYVDDVNLVYVD